MHELDPGDQSLAELLTLTVSVNEWGTAVYRNQQGQIHRIHGPAMIFSNGDQCWHQNGHRHRTDGPALALSSGMKKWYQNGLLHRTDGPAIEWANGDQEWWLDGERIS